MDADDEGKRWMLAFQAGDEKAFDRIVGRYETGVYHFVRRTIRDEGRAEDLTQDVFLRVYRSRRRYQPTAGFRTWLYTIASRLALNEMRATRRRRRIFSDGFAQGVREPGEADDFWGNVPERREAPPEERLEERELDAAVDGILRTLPKNQRLAVEIQRAGDLSYQEIAQVLGVTTLAVKSLLVRARESLKEGLAHYFEGRAPVDGERRPG